MAKKKQEATLSYLQMPLPSGGKYYKITKTAFGGLNRRCIQDSGEMSQMENISNREYPYLVPAPTTKEVYKYYYNPIGIFGFDDFLLIIYRDGEFIKIDYLTETKKYTGFLQVGGATEADEAIQRCVVPFHLYDTATDPLTGKFVKKLLIFPDKKSMDFEITEDNFAVDDMSVNVMEYTNKKDPYTPPDTASHAYYYRNIYNNDIYRWVDDASDTANSGWKVSTPPTVPNIQYATVHLSRVFGVDDSRVYASGYNDYTNWNLDTVEESNESNAWVTPTQANTKAGGSFTGITAFQNHVICFKQDFMHEVYNTKNPFRLQDIYAEGAIDNRTIQEVDGSLLFVSADGVKMYTGSNPRIIDTKLAVLQYDYAVSGSYGSEYHLYCKTDSGYHWYVYDTNTELWSEREAPGIVLGFATNNNGMYMLCKHGCVYRVDSQSYAGWSFSTEMVMNKTVDIKHVKKIQMMVEIPRTIRTEESLVDNSGANFEVYLVYDGNGSGTKVFSSDGRTGRFPVRVKPHRTAHYALQLLVKGTGFVRFCGMELFLEDGGDMYVSGS